jgi:hypothetical protein
VKELCEPAPKKESPANLSPTLEKMASKINNLPDEDSKLEQIQQYLVTENGDDTVKAHLYALLNFQNLSHENLLGLSREFTVMKVFSV